MFYDKDLMSSKSLCKVWRAGHGLNEDSDEELSLENICNKLDLWVDSSHEDAHRRLSLRTSSIFINGAARQYKRKLELLFEDTQKLDWAMSRRKRFLSSIDDENIISQTFTDPEYQDTFNSDFGEPLKEQTQGSSCNDKSSTCTDYVRSDPNSSSDFQSTVTVYQKCDKGVQTTPKIRRNRRPRSEQNLPCEGDFDQNLPFGVVMVYENYHTRVPSKIIFSSLNADVSKLV